MFNRKIPILKIKLFTAGKKIPFNGKILTVDHVYVKYHKLMVKFAELDKLVDSDTLECEYTELDLNRNKEI